MNSETDRPSEVPFRKLAYSPDLTRCKLKGDGSTHGEQVNVRCPQLWLSPSQCLFNETVNLFILLMVRCGGDSQPVYITNGQMWG